MKIPKYKLKASEEQAQVKSERSGFSFGSLKESFGTIPSSEKEKKAKPVSVSADFFSVHDFELKKMQALLLSV